MNKRDIIGHYQGEKWFDMSEVGVSVATAKATEKLFSGRSVMPTPVIVTETPFYSYNTFTGGHSPSAPNYIHPFGVTFSRPPDVILTTVVENFGYLSPGWHYSFISMGNYFRPANNIGSFTEMYYWSVGVSSINCMGLINANTFGDPSRGRMKTKMMVFDPEDGP